MCVASLHPRNHLLPRVRHVQRREAFKARRTKSRAGGGGFSVGIDPSDDWITPRRVRLVRLNNALQETEKGPGWGSIQIPSWQPQLGTLYVTDPQQPPTLAEPSADPPQEGVDSGGGVLQDSWVHKNKEKGKDPTSCGQEMSCSPAGPAGPHPGDSLTH